MFGRYFFVVFGAICLFWIAYASLDIVGKGDSLSPEMVFGIEDGSVLRINRGNELVSDDLQFHTTIANQKLYNKLKHLLPKDVLVYLSEKRSHLLLSSRFNWSHIQIKKMLRRLGCNVKSNSIKSFQIPGYQVVAKRNQLYFYKDEMPLTAMEKWLFPDQKASANWLQFSKNKMQITDIYFLKNGKVEYITNDVMNMRGRKVNDKELFSLVLPESFDDYHFVEKQFCISNDDSFAKSPMSHWVEMGFVQFTYKNENVIVSDVANGQFPIAVLNDYLHIDEENAEFAHFKNIRLTNNFPSNIRTGFYIYNLNNFVVISENKELCEEILKENKLGNTLGTNQFKLDAVFSGLPKFVSERKIDAQRKISRSVYHSKVMETIIPQKNDGDEESSQNRVKKAASVSFNIEEPIADFKVLNGKGSVLVLTKTNQIHYFQNNKLVWKRQLLGRILGKMEVFSGNQTVVASTSSFIHQFGIGNNSSFQKIIDLESNNATQQVTSYQYNSKDYFVFSNQKNEIVTIDGNGKTMYKIPTGLNQIELGIKAWVSRGILFYAVCNNNTFKMFDANKRKLYRSFSIHQPIGVELADNEIYVNAHIQNEWVSINQKGAVYKKSALPELTSIHMNDNENEFVVYSKHMIRTLSPKGQITTELNLLQNNIEYVDFLNFNGTKIFSMVDGLENNVYLYLISGDKFVDLALEGSKKAVLSQNGQVLLLTTIVDNFIVQYTVK